MSRFSGAFFVMEMLVHKREEWLLWRNPVQELP